jgi:hypothetical protein
VKAAEKAAAKSKNPKDVQVRFQGSIEVDE